ncbi:DUF2608 domain-containing protein [Parachlamydia acanthamoebae]|uniref:DUF2608 domain-containing protein n=1 Tax=Parachlamydia acanthamoebae TaxID=83552 RepID=UPI0001C174B1|nr:DUF2608 domain-containing protein [Parachlamydia acanthamoebae]EFB41392.1 hypothetical protein pah_c045o111 [Parachlamydia acanthamoebae str. Hall's coccus]
MKKITILLIALYLSQATAQALIVEAPNLAAFEKVTQNIGQDSLVLFDVDDTLIVSKDHILRPAARHIWFQLAKKTLENPAIVPPGKHDGDYFFGQILSAIEYEIVDPKVVDIIHSLQQRHIKTIAFTRMGTGPCGAISSMEDWRIAHLKKFCLDFSQALPEFQNLKIQVPGNQASLFKQGILCSNKQAKGPVFIAFLNSIGWKPSKVIFIDNSFDYLKSVEDALEGTGIEFIGFHYTDVENRPCIVDEALAEFQLMHLAKTGIWLSDSEALKKMNGLQQIQHINEINAYIENIDEDTLVVFDVDEVLISTTDIFLHPECDEIFLGLIYDAFEKAKTDKEKDELENQLSLTMLLPKRVLVEGSTPGFIESLQVKGIKTMALTSCPTGRFGVIPSVEQWRIRHLKTLGIDFSAEAPCQESFSLTEICKKNRPAPLFENGILFSKGYSKGEVLIAFLKRINWKPSNVLFIDDLADNLESVKQYLDEFDIPFVGFHYLGASLPKDKIDPDLIKFQFDYLLKHGKWLSDEEIRRNDLHRMHE